LATWLEILPAFCPQIAPVMPFLPVVPVHKYCSVYNLRIDRYHGMEEVIGSIPIRSTKLFPTKLSIYAKWFSIAILRFGVYFASLFSRSTPISEYNGAR
jgi:hypothetical protein